MAYLSRSSRAAAASTLAIGLVSRGPGEFVDNGRVGVGHVQCQKARTGHEARVGDADGGSREVVVAVVIVLDDSSAE